MKNYLLVPFDDSGYKNNIFNSPYGILQERLLEKGIVLNTIDLGDPTKADRILFFNYNENVFNRCKALNIPKEKLILFLFEPQVVIPKQYDKKVMNQFGEVFTWRDDLLVNKSFRKFNYMQGQSFGGEMKDFDSKRYLVLINANKYSFEDNELYSFRRDAIHYFQKVSKDFDFYGYGWDKKILKVVIISFLYHGKFTLKRMFRAVKQLIKSSANYPSYRGVVDDKLETLSNYKFCLCFENELSEGFITEKIFDCFFAGTVPVYLGDKNIKKSIPENCYVDFNIFGTFEKLDKYLMAMPKEEYEEYVQAGMDFINGNNFKSNWSVNGVINKIVDSII